MADPLPSDHRPEDASPAQTPLVTLFVIAYRQADTVREAVASALAQTWPRLEVVLSDDASPDATFEIMQEMAEAYDGPHRVTLNRNPRNLGVTAHLDRIMEISSGALVVQNAGDDVSRPDRVETLARAWLDSGRRAKLLHSDAVIIDATGAEIGYKGEPGKMRADPSALNIIRHSLFALGAVSAWDREVFDVFGPLGGDLDVEDTVLPVRAAVLGELRYIEEPLLRWRAGGLSWGQPGARDGRDFLFGQRLKLMRWHLRTHRAIARDLDRVDFPGREACVAENDARLRRLAFEIAAADARPRARLAALPSALSLSLARRDSFFLRQQLKYLMAPLYARWLDLRYAPEQLKW